MKILDDWREIKKNRVKLVVNLPKTSNKNKPELDSHKVDFLLPRQKKEPAPLLETYGQYCLETNRYSYKPAQRLKALEPILGNGYLLVLQVKSNFLVGGIPDTMERRAAILGAIHYLEQIIIAYKRIFVERFNISWFKFVKQKDQIIQYAINVLELISLLQELYAMRYQILPANSWKDANQIFFSIASCLNIDEAYPLLRNQFVRQNEAKKHITTASVNEIYSIIHTFGVMHVEDWPSEHMHLVASYVKAVEPVEYSYVEDELEKLAVDQYVIQKSQPIFAQAKIPKYIENTILMNFNLIHAKLLEDYQYLIDKRQKPDLVEQFDIQVAENILAKMKVQFKKQKREEERQYIMGGKRLRIYSGWQDCTQLIQDLSQWSYQEIQQKRKFKDSLAERSAMIGDSDKAVDESEWLLIDESKTGARLRTKETKFTTLIYIGQLVIYSPLENIEAMELAHVRRIIRINDKEVDIGLSKLQMPAEAIALQKPSMKKTTQALSGLLLGEQNPYQMITSHKHLFSEIFDNLILTRKAYRMPFKILKSDTTPQDYDICSLYIDEDNPEHIDDHVKRISKEKADKIAAEKAAIAAEEAEKKEKLAASLKNNDGELMAREWEPGDTLHNTYEIQAILGEGGMGKVYKAYHSHWRALLAIKRAKDDFLEKPDAIKSIEREAQNWINLGTHPNIVGCYYIRLIEKIPLLFAEYVDGDSLQGWIKDNKTIELNSILDIAIQFAWGLDHAHKHQMIHRDVKPGNVMMTKNGIVKVTDFGLAHIVNEVIPDSSTMTQAFCSPEQMDQQPLTIKTDMWSWALSVVEMFTGEVTWMFGAIAPAILEGYLDEGKEGRPEMPQALADILMTCFAKAVDDRPENMQILANQLIELYESTNQCKYPRTIPDTEDNVDSINNRAVSLIDMGKTEDACSLWQKALSIQPNHPETGYNYGLYQWRDGKLADDELLRKLDGTHRSNRGFWFADYMQGLIHLERDDNETAKDHFVKMAKFPVGKVEAEHWMSVVYQRGNQLQTRKLVKTFSGEHLDMICTMASDNEGISFISAGLDGKINFWHYDTQNISKTLEVGSITCCALSPDNDRLLLGTMSGMARQWVIEQNEMEEVIPHNASVLAVAFSHDGMVAASSGTDKMINVWETETKQRLANYSGHLDSVTAIAFSPNDKYLGSTGLDQYLRIWQIGKAGAIISLDAHEGGGTAVVWKSDTMIFSAGKDNLIRLWDLKRKKCIREYHGHQHNVLSLSLSKEGQFLVSSAEDNTIRVWHCEKGQCLRTFKNDAEVLSTFISKDGKLLFSGDRSWNVKCWAINLYDEYHKAPYLLAKVVEVETSLEAANTYQEAITKAKKAFADKDFINSLRYVRHARKQVGFGRSQEALKLWCSLYRKFPLILLSNVEQVNTRNIQNGYINCLHLDSKGNTLFVGDEFGRIRIYSSQKEKEIRQFEAHVGRINGITYDEDHKIIYSAAQDNKIISWNINGKKIIEFNGHTKAVTAIVLIQKNNYLISASEDTTIRLWHIASGQCIQQYAGHVNFVNKLAVSLDERYLVSAGGSVYGIPDNKVFLWDIATGEKIKTFSGHDHWVSGVCITPDSQKIISSSHDHHIKVWSIASGQCLKTLEGHQSGISALSLSSNGSQLLSGSIDRTTRLWDIHTGVCMHTFYGHEQPVRDIILSNDNRYVITTSLDRRVQTWILNWDLEDKSEVEWDWRVFPWLEAFINQQLPRKICDLTAEKSEKFPPHIDAFFNGRGKATWEQKDIQQLWNQVGASGYGWISAKGLLNQLQKLATRIEKPIDTIGETVICRNCGAQNQRPPQCQSCGQNI